MQTIKAIMWYYDISFSEAEYFCTQADTELLQNILYAYNHGGKQTIWRDI